MIDQQELWKVTAKLSEYTGYENDEFQEATDILIQLAESYPDYDNENLEDMIFEELKCRLDYYQTNTKFVKREETFTRTVLELVHTDY